MQELISIAKEFTPGAWGIWTGVLMFAGWFFREWRETRKLSADDRLARRDGYAAQVQMLMTENRLLLADIADVRRQYDEHRKQCIEETNELRQRINDLEKSVSTMQGEIDDHVEKAADYEQQLANRQC